MALLSTMLTEKMIGGRIYIVDRADDRCVAGPFDAPLHPRFLITYATQISGWFATLETPDGLMLFSGNAGYGYDTVGECEHALYAYLAQEWEAARQGGALVLDLAA